MVGYCGVRLPCTAPKWVAGRATVKKSVRFLGELALRVTDLHTTRDFYRDTVGLEVFEEGEGHVFFRIGEAVEGHPQLLALFARGVAVVPATTSLDHFAFIIDRSDYEDERRRLEELGVQVHVKTFPHFHWRSLFFPDPEGNTVEFVAYDPDVGAE